MTLSNGRYGEGSGRRGHSYEDIIRIFGEEGIHPYEPGVEPEIEGDFVRKKRIDVLANSTTKLEHYRTRLRERLGEGRTFEGHKGEFYFSAIPDPDNKGKYLYEVVQIKGFRPKGEND